MFQLSAMNLGIAALNDYFSSMTRAHEFRCRWHSYRTIPAATETFKL